VEEGAASPLLHDITIRSVWLNRKKEYRWGIVSRV
jgi:hypothetical protein